MSDEKRNPEEKEIQDRPLSDMQYEEVLNRMRIHEEIMRGIQKIIYKLDEDYQLAKHKKKVACMCCPLLHKSKKS